MIKKQLTGYLTIILLGGLLQGKINAFMMPQEVSWSIAWVKQVASSTVASLLKTKPVVCLKGMISYHNNQQNKPQQIEQISVLEEKENDILIAGTLELKEQDVQGNGVQQDDIEVTTSEVQDITVLPSVDVSQEVSLNNQATLKQDTIIHENANNTISVKAKVKNHTKDVIVAGSTGAASPAVMTGLQYITGNEMIASANIIPAVKISMMNTMIQKLHGVKEGTEAIDTMISNALIGTSLPMLPVTGAVAELSAIVSEVIASKGGAGQLVKDIDWMDVTLGSTKESQEENKYNQALVREVQKLTKNKELAELLTTVALSTLESTVIYSVLGILGIATGGTGVLAVAGGAAVYGAGKGVLDYLVCRSQRQGFAAKTAESVALKYALKIGGSLTMIDVLPIVAAELAVSIVQTGVHQVGGWDALKEEVGDATIKAIQKRLSLYQSGINSAIESLQKIADNTLQQSLMYGEPNDEKFVAFLDGKKYEPQYEDNKKQEEKQEQKGWFARLFADPNGSMSDDEYESSFDDSDDDEDNENEVFYDCQEMPS